MHKYLLTFVQYQYVQIILPIQNEDEQDGFLVLQDTLLKMNKTKAVV